MCGEALGGEKREKGPSEMGTNPLDRRRTKDQTDYCQISPPHPLYPFSPDVYWRFSVLCLVKDPGDPDGIRHLGCSEGGKKPYSG